MHGWLLYRVVAGDTLTSIRRDLRPYTKATVAQIVAANPYGLHFNSANATACYEAAGTEMPLVRADWFVFAAARPPLAPAAVNLASLSSSPFKVAGPPSPVRVASAARAGL